MLHFPCDMFFVLHFIGFPCLNVTVDGVLDKLFEEFTVFSSWSQKECFDGSSPLFYLSDVLFSLMFDLCSDLRVIGSSLL